MARASVAVVTGADAPRLARGATAQYGYHETGRSIFDNMKSLNSCFAIFTLLCPQVRTARMFTYSNT